MRATLALNGLKYIKPKRIGAERVCNFKTCAHVKGTHREKAPSNKTPALTKNTKIWVFGSLVHLGTENLIDSGGRS